MSKRRAGVFRGQVRDLFESGIYAGLECFNNGNFRGTFKEKILPFLGQPPRLSRHKTKQPYSATSHGGLICYSSGKMQNICRLRAMTGTSVLMLWD